MAVNFFDSAGSDLDNLFSANNSNAGALGYLTSGNQDLGNRYFKGSLNRTIGYYNSAGSDIGYQRGKIVAPTATITATKSNWGTKSLFLADGTCSEYDGEETTYFYTYYAHGRGVLTPKITITNSMPINAVQWYIETIIPGNSRFYNVITGVNYNSTTLPNPNIYIEEVQDNCNSLYNWSNTTYNFENASQTTEESSPLLGTTTTLSVNIAVMSGNFKRSTGSSHTAPQINVRVKAYAYNNIGGIWLYSPWVMLTEKRTK